MSAQLSERRLSGIPLNRARAGGPSPPLAECRPFTLPSPHGNRNDEYYWLRDDARSDEAVLAYLRAENAYRETVLAPLEPLREKLYREIVGRIKLDDASVPYRYRGHWYYARYDAREQYPVHARKADLPEAREQVLLDEAALAREHDYFELGSYEISRDDRLLAWTEDHVGRGQYTLRIRQLESGELLTDTISGVEADVTWTADSNSLLYIEQNPTTLMGYRVRRHVLGSDPASDRVVYEETDDRFYLGLGASKDEEYLFIVCSSTLASEQHYARADDPDLRFRPIIRRAEKHEYEAEHFGGRWIMRSNFNAANFRLVSVPVGQSGGLEACEEILAHSEQTMLTDFDVFDEFIAIEERNAGLCRIRIQRWGGAGHFYLEAPRPGCNVELAENMEVAASSLRYCVNSLATPETTCEYDLVEESERVLKREPVLGGFDAERYVTEYLRVPVRDGEQVPVALVYRKGLSLNGTAPLLQHGYGAYGLSSDPEFDSCLFSLLDRGFVYAIAQVRGGQELGRRWYDSGRLLNKCNSFNDFIDVTDHLVAQGYADPRRVFASGSSAGGLLMGVIANVAAERYRAIVTDVPFVDVLTTMLDESVPLTSIEYEEWGDPCLPGHYEYMLSYSPYDNVRAQDYPAMFVSTGLWDGQVQYYEPAKWVARLRRLKTDDNPLLFRVDLGAGHGGPSGRFEQYRELAEVYAFLLDQAGIRE